MIYVAFQTCSSSSTLRHLLPNENRKNLQVLLRREMHLDIFMRIVFIQHDERFPNNLFLLPFISSHNRELKLTKHIIFMFPETNCLKIAATKKLDKEMHLPGIMTKKSCKYINIWATLPNKTGSGKLNSDPICFFFDSSPTSVSGKIKFQQIQS